jgi:hypothetical protein
MVPSDSPSDLPPTTAEAAALPSRPRRRRRFARFMLRLTLLLVVTAALATFFRLELVNRAGPWLLTRELEVPVELGVARFDWRQSHIDRLILGSQRDIVIEDVTLAYDPLSARLQSVEIGRIALLARYDPAKGPGVSLGDLDPLVDRLRAMASTPGDPNAASAPLPDMLVKSIEIGLSSPVGFINGSGQANVNEQAVIAQFTLREQQDYARVDISLAAPLSKDGKPPLGDVTLNMDAHSALWPLLGLAQPTGGSVKASAHLRMPEAGGAADAPLALADWDAEIVNFAYPGFATPFNGRLGGAVAYGADWISLEKLTGDIKGGISTAFSAKIGGNLRASPLTGTQALAGDLDLKLNGGDFALLGTSVTGVTMALPLSLSAERGADATTLDLAITKPATMSFQKLSVADGSVTLPKATSLSFKGDGASTVHIGWSDAAPISADFNLALAKSSLAVEPKALGERLLVAMPESKLTGRYMAGTPLSYAFDVKNAQVAAPARALTLGKVAVNLVGGADSLKAKLSTGALAGLGSFTPVKGEAEATLTGDKATFKARFQGDDQPLNLSLTGKADIAKSSGSVDLKLAPLDFAVGSLQPYNLFPPLRDYLDDVSGRIELEGPVRFDGGGITSDLKLGLKNFSGKVGPVLLTNVNAVINIDRPWPLSTKADQVVAVELADIGLPLTNVLFRFKVSDGKTLDLKESRLDMAGGKVALDPAILTFDAPAQNLMLRVDGISVGQLFDTLGIAGLSGEGNVSGTVPVTIFPGGIAIPEAKLAATAPGVLRYDPAQAPLALQSAGESVAMALQALADFHYEKLMLDLTRNLTGDVNLGLHITGRNPSFYDGYPVEFNLSIEGRLDQALKEGLAGYKVPDMIQQQLEKLSP